MINFFLKIPIFLAIAAWLIVAATSRAGDDRYADAVRVFDCDFGENWDENYDRWPDRWTRKEGNDYPHYVSIQTQDDAAAKGGRCLTIDLDGAAAAISSPPIRVMSRFGYIFDAQLKNEGLVHSAVVLSLDFLDKSGRVLKSTKAKPVANTRGWQHVRLGEIELNDPAIDRVVIGLQIVRGAKGDLKGRVSLADVWLARLPRIVVSTNNPCNVYSGLGDVVIRSELSGIREANPEIRFQLLDEVGTPRDSAHFKLDGKLIVEDAKRSDDVVDGVGEAPAGYEGTLEWRPKLPDFGFYRVIVKMLSAQVEGRSDEDRELDSRTIWLAVVPPLPMPRHGEFGWTLPHGDRPLSFQALSRLLPQVGISWVKVPAWFNSNDSHRADELIRFVELIGASNIEVVGVIDRPPAGSEIANRLGRDAAIADLLSLDPSAWAPALEPVMSRLSLRVRWWQLGRDTDTSFAGDPGLNKRIDELRTQLFRFGQDVRLGMCWDWDSVDDNSRQVKWDFEQLRSENPPTEKEFAAQLARPLTNSAQRWILIEPPAPITDPNVSAANALASRSVELAGRMIAAKVAGVDHIFIANPFNDENGLMHANGMPSELLLPWRTTAVMLGGAEYLGELQLPSGSKNRVFLRPDRQVVMVVWNQEPVQEVLFIGNDVHCIDIWGRTTSPQLRGKEQIIQVGPMPTFVLGLQEAITRWSMALSFEQLHVPSVFSKPHPNSVHFKNFFPQGVGGSMRIVVPQDEKEFDHLKNDDKSPERPGFTPDRWSLEPPTGTFQTAAGEESTFPFEIRLKNALYGEQPVRIEFNVEADEPYQFTVFRKMEVGTADLMLDVKTHLDKDNVLIVEQLMQNHGKELADFRCNLYAKGHRWQRTQVYRLGDNVDRKIYRYPHGSDLIGQDMLLEIEERNGPRVLKYRFTVTESSAEENADEKSGDKPGQKKSDRDKSDRENRMRPAANEIDVDETAAMTGR